MARKKRNRKYLGSIVFIFLIAIGAALVYWQYQNYLSKKYFSDLGISKYANGLEAVEINYGEEIEKQARTYHLNADFLKALCMLECGGRKKVPSRFEPHIFKKLQQLKRGDINHYERFTTSQINMLSHAALKNLASSWGPFQLLGIRSMNLGCKVHDLRNERAIINAVKWIELDYGSLIKKKQYKDAFHKHNTGRTYPALGPPKTYDPQYVNRGLQFMKYFEMN